MAKNKKNEAGFNASSMADVAFLLLIFFLVATTIDIEKGISVILPPYCEGCEEPNPPSKRNTFFVKINTQDQLLVRGNELDLAQLKDRTKEFILNPTKNKNLSKSPRHALIALQNDRGTSYEMYLAVYNELKAAYSELWEDKARQLFGIAYNDLPRAKKKIIRKEIPLVISESEPTNYQALK